MSATPVPPPVQPEFSSATPSRNSGYAVASLVTALLCLGLVPVVLGHIALGKIKRSAGALKGQGLAIAGLVMGYLQLILLPLLIIPILFIGARAWKKGSDRAGCIMNQRNVQQSVRGYQGINSINPGSGVPIDWQEIFGTGKFLDREPVCPSGGKYEYAETAPNIGEMVIKCSKAEAEQHVPRDHAEW
jgi:hypothetical protein